MDGLPQYCHIQHRFDWIVNKSQAMFLDQKVKSVLLGFFVCLFVPLISIYETVELIIVTAIYCKKFFF